MNINAEQIQGYLEQTLDHVESLQTRCAALESQIAALTQDRDDLILRLEALENENRESALPPGHHRRGKALMIDTAKK